MQDGVFLKEHTYNDILLQKYKDYSRKIIDFVTLSLFSYGLVHTMDGILNSTLITIPKDYNMKYLWINGGWLFRSGVC